MFLNKQEGGCGMRPIKLTMQAFGAYAKKEVIDFEKLGTEQIFVISGKTGQENRLFLMRLVLRFLGKQTHLIGKVFRCGVILRQIKKLLK